MYGVLQIERPMTRTDSQDQEQVPSCVVVLPLAQTSIDPTKKILGCTKLAKMMSLSVSFSRNVTVDVTRFAEEVSPAKMSI